MKLVKKREKKVSNESQHVRQRLDKTKVVKVLFFLTVIKLSCAPKRRCAGWQYDLIELINRFYISKVVR